MVEYYPFYVAGTFMLLAGLAIAGLAYWQGYHKAKEEFSQFLQKIIEENDNNT